MPKRRAWQPLVGTLACIPIGLLVYVITHSSGAVHLREAAILHGFTNFGGPRIEMLAHRIASLCDPIPFAIFGLGLVAIAIARHTPRTALLAPLILLAA